MWNRALSGRRAWTLAAIVILNLVFGPFAAHATERFEGDSLPPEFQRVLRDYEEAWRSHDAEALTSLFTEDGYVLSDRSAPHHGREAIRLAYANAGGPLFLRALSAERDGDFGAIVGLFRHADSAPDAGKFVLLLRREADGRWQIRADMDNALAPSAPPSAADAVHRIAQCAQALLRAVPDASARRALNMPFAHDARRQWSYLPGSRPGVRIDALSEEGRLALHDLMRATLSGSGYLTATTIMRLEEVLRDMENGNPARDSGAYTVAIFGDPSGKEPWSWRLEGHHLSLNLTCAGEEIPSVTPFFLGASPAELRRGALAGLRPLGDPEDLAFELLASLSADQRRAAVTSDTAPADILTRSDPAAARLPDEGVRASALSSQQRLTLLHLIESIAHHLDPALAEAHLARIRSAGFSALTFAWAGAAERGKGHYFRVQGPALLIEFDNTQNDANHIHLVWRDLADDFGTDLLRRHYELHGEPHQHD